MNRIEQWLLRKEPKQRLMFGLLFCVLAIVGYFIIDRYNTGFLGGFITGILAGLGIGLVVTHRLQKRL